MTAQSTCHCCDTEAVRHVLKEYGRLLDQKNFRAWAALFAQHGQWLGGDAYGVIQGPEAIESFAMREFAGTPPCVHIFGNMAVDVTGQRAAAWSRWMLVEQGKDALTIKLAGSYSDELIKDAQGWRFLRREVTLDLPVMG